MKIKIWINVYNLTKINWDKFECFVTRPDPAYDRDLLSTDIDLTEYLVENREYMRAESAHKATLVKLTPQAKEQRRLDLAL